MTKCMYCDNDAVVILQEEPVCDTHNEGEPEYDGPEDSYWYDTYPSMDEQYDKAFALSKELHS